MKRNQAPVFREITFGLEDSLVSTLGAVTGIAAGTQNSTTVLLAGIVTVAVEALSMIGGSFISSKTQVEMEMRQLEKEREELANKPIEESAELEKFLEEKKLSKSERDLALRIISKNPEWMMEEMAVHELGISPDQREKPKTNSVFMGISYFLGGSVPVIAYGFLPVSTALAWSVGMTLLALAGLGLMKARLGGSSLRRSVLEVLGISITVTLVGYLIGNSLGKILK